MAFCANCGAEVNGRFCAKCGTPVAAPAGPPPGQQYPPPPPGGQTYTPPAGQPYGAPGAQGLQENIASALCYLFGIPGVLFLVLEPYNRNRNIRFHAFQAIFAWVGVAILSILLGMVTGSLVLVPLIGLLLSGLIWSCFWLAVFILCLMLMYKAYNNEKWVLPVVGPLAEKQA